MSFILMLQGMQIEKSISDFSGVVFNLNFQSLRRSSQINRKNKKVLTSRTQATPKQLFCEL